MPVQLDLLFALKAGSGQLAVSPMFHFASPNACCEEIIATETRMALPMECATAMNEWATQHPAWRVVRARYGIAEQET